MRIDNTKIQPHKSKSNEKKCLRNSEIYTLTELPNEPTNSTFAYLIFL